MFTGDYTRNIDTHKPTSSVKSNMNDPGGVDTKKTLVHWVYEFIEKLLCALCNSLLCPPMQMTCCGHRICQNCATTRLPQFIHCPFCSATGTPTTILDRGYQRELNKRQVNCPRCEESDISIEKLSKHWERHRDLPCEDCGQKFILPQQLEKHQQQDCQHRKVSCPLAFMGCSTQIEQNKLGDHYRTNTHQKCLLKFSVQIVPQCSQKQLKRNIQKVNSEKYQFGLRECLDKMEELLRNVLEKLDHSGRLKMASQALHEKLEKLNEQLKKSRDLFENGAKIVQSSQEILLAIQKTVEELKSKPMGLRLLTTDGIYLFKIAIQNLTNGDQSFQLETIHTSQSGYRLALSYDTYKDGQSKQRQLAISFTILKGEFDAILFWPMLYPITVSILDLSGKSNHISCSIPQTSQMANFHKPTSDANPSVRVQKFCAIDEILQQKNTYVQDNAIYLQFQMDFVTTADPIHEIAANKLLNDNIHSDNIQRNILSDVK